MIVLIDNYDSFSYNLYQLIGGIRPDLTVIRNDRCTVDDLRALAGEIPIFGVCLGHQAICEAFGGTVSYARALMHGKVSEVTPLPGSRLFRGMEAPFPAARYHSLAAVEDTLPDCLRVTARTEDGEIMAVEHREYPVFGVQSHPESVMTPDGGHIIRNFLASL